MSENEEKVVSVVENSQIDSDYQENKEVKTSSKGTSSNPIWVTILCVLLSVLFTFFATFGVLSDSFKTQLNYYLSHKGEGSQELSQAFTLVEAINKLYLTHYIYDVDFDLLAGNMLQAYAAAAGDPYAYYYTPEAWAEEVNSNQGNSVGLGVNVSPIYLDAAKKYVKSITISHVMSGSAADEIGLKKYDSIISVDGVNIDGMLYDDVVNMIGGDVGTEVKIGFIRDGQIYEKVAKRCRFATETVIPEVINTDKGKIGYVRLLQFMDITPGQFKSAIRTLKDEGCNSFVFDVRDNGGGYLDAIVETLDYILPSGPIVTIEYKDKDKKDVYNSDANTLEADCVVVLANSHTASAAELFTSSLKDYKYATIMGEKTYGKGCGQTFFNLPNGGVFKLTSFLYYPPFSGNYDGIGVYPDIEVQLDEELRKKSILLLEKDEDTQLQAAVEYILEHID